MKNTQQGAALVEFALILPLLLILTFVTTELGRALYRYNTTAKVVRDAVRYLSVQQPGTRIQEARNIIVYGNPQGVGEPLDPALGPGNVPDPTWQLAGASPVINTVTVRVAGYQFRPLIGQFFGVRFAVLTFSDISATMRSPL